jgi:hypothetical protein
MASRRKLPAWFSALSAAASVVRTPPTTTSLAPGATRQASPGANTPPSMGRENPRGIPEDAAGARNPLTPRGRTVAQPGSLPDSNRAAAIRAAETA